MSIFKKKTPSSFTTAIILSAGSSTRMGEGVNKQYLEISGKPVLYYSVKAFEDSDLINEIFIVGRKEDFDLIKRIVDENKFKKVKKIISGGDTRQKSVEHAIKNLGKKTGFVAIHDGARPLVRPHDISLCCLSAYKNKASILAIPSTDTVKKVSEDGNSIEKTLDRNLIYKAQTPQIFETELYLSAMKNAKETGFSVTDDASLVEAVGEKVYIVEGSRDNIKITYKEDIAIAEAILKSRKEE